MSLNKLRWKSRKGLRELDILLQNFISHEYKELSDYQKRIFEEVLEIETYDLLNAITGKSSYNEEYEPIIKKLYNLSSLKNEKE